MQLRGGVETIFQTLGIALRVARTESHLCCGSAGTYSVLHAALAQHGMQIAEIPAHELQKMRVALQGVVAKHAAASGAEIAAAFAKALQEARP